MTDEYQGIYKNTELAAKLEAWTAGLRPPKDISGLERNLLGLVVYAAAALRFFLDHLLSAQIRRGDESSEGEAHQLALVELGPDPASESKIRAAILTFLDRQELEHDDTGRWKAGVDGEVTDEDPLDLRIVDDPEPVVSEESLESDLAATPALGDYTDDETEEAPAVELWRLPAQVATNLSNAGRNILPVVIALWSEEDTKAAWNWAETVREGPDTAPPPPDIVSAEYLEDLDLTSQDGRAKVLESAGVPGGETFEWDESMWLEMMTWAIPVHRRDRGEQIKVPAPPSILRADDGLFSTILGHVSANSAISREKVIEDLWERDIAVAYAVEALETLDYLTEDDGELSSVLDDYEGLEIAELHEICWRLQMRLPAHAPTIDEAGVALVTGQGTEEELEQAALEAEAEKPREEE